MSHRPYMKLPFDTVGHYHFPSVALPDNDYLWLMVVECRDGCHYLEWEYPPSEPQREMAPEVFDPELLPFREPAFYESDDLALDAAFAIIQRLWPELDMSYLHEWRDDWCSGKDWRAV